MRAIVVDQQLCDVCGACIAACGIQILGIEQGRLVVRDPSLCMVCKACEAACHSLAIHVYRDGEVLPEMDASKAFWCPAG